MNYLPLGYRGYYGFGETNKYNKKVQKANKLVDEYNSTINTFETEEENNIFANDFNRKIYNIFSNDYQNGYNQALEDIKRGV